MRARPRLSSRPSLGSKPHRCYFSPSPVPPPPEPLRPAAAPSLATLPLPCTSSPRPSPHTSGTAFESVELMVPHLLKPSCQWPPVAFRVKDKLLGITHQALHTLPPDDHSAIDPCPRPKLQALRPAIAPHTTTWHSSQPQGLCTHCDLRPHTPPSPPPSFHACFSGPFSETPALIPPV